MDLTKTVPAGTYFAVNVSPPNASWQITNQTTSQVVASAGNFTYGAGPFTLSAPATLTKYAFGGTAASIIILSVGN